MSILNLGRCLLCALTFGALVSCNTVTSPEYIDAYWQARSNVSSDAIVGPWLTRTNLSFLGAKSNLKKLLTVEPGGNAISKMQVTDGITGRKSETGNVPLKWRYMGGGVWRFYGHNVRAVARYTGSKLVVEGWTIVGYYGSVDDPVPMDSPHTREVYYRPGSSELEGVRDSQKEAKVDWVTKPSADRNPPKEFFR